MGGRGAGGAARPPVIVIGMHRSGTSMLTRMLEELGLFVGVSRDHNDESPFFVELNRWLMRVAGGDWDHPEPVLGLVDDAEVRDMVAAYFRRMGSSPRLARFLGWRGYLAHRSLFRIAMPWGWKDPRNTYTLPLWLALFPDARVVHICRNGVDVAASLRARQRKHYTGAAARARLSRQGSVGAVWPRLPGGRFAGSPRCLDLEGGFSLWEQYVAQARQHVGQRGDRAMEVCYEDLLAHPVETLRPLAGFLGLPAPVGGLARIAASVRSARAAAYRDDPELSAFAHAAADRLAVYGYAA